MLLAIDGHSHNRQKEHLDIPEFGVLNPLKFPYSCSQRLSMEQTQDFSNQLILFGGTFAMLLMAASIAVFIYLYQKKLIKKKLEMQAIEDELKEKELNSAYEVMQAQDEERKRIAADIHDNLGSIMVTLSMYADGLLQDRPDKEAIAEKISEVSKLAATETRKISHQLHSGVLQYFGLKSALMDLKETVSGTKDITMEVEFAEEIEMPSEKAINLYRVCQELVNNSLKHARASKLNFEVSQTNQGLMIQYRDNGVGFDIEKVKKGLGIQGIQTRIQPYEGDLEINSSEKGSHFIIRIPSPVES